MIYKVLIVSIADDFWLHPLTFFKVYEVGCHIPHGTIYQAWLISHHCVECYLHVMHVCVHSDSQRHFYSIHLNLFISLYYFFIFPLAHKKLANISSLYLATLLITSNQKHYMLYLYLYVQQRWLCFDHADAHSQWFPW